MKIDVEHLKLVSMLSKDMFIELARNGFNDTSELTAITAIRSSVSIALSIVNESIRQIPHSRLAELEDNDK